MQQITEISDPQLWNSWLDRKAMHAHPKLQTISVSPRLFCGLWHFIIICQQIETGRESDGNHGRCPVAGGTDGLSGFLPERLPVCSVSCCLRISTISALHLTAALSLLRTKAWQWLCWCQTDRRSQRTAPRALSRHGNQANYLCPQFARLLAMTR